MIRKIWYRIKYFRSWIRKPIPILLPEVPGRIWWVGEGGVDAEEYGENPDKPYATISYAIAHALNKDRVFILPGAEK